MNSSLNNGQDKIQWERSSTANFPNASVPESFESTAKRFITDEDIEELECINRNWFGMNDQAENRMTSNTEMNAIVEGLVNNDDLNHCLFSSE